MRETLQQYCLRAGREELLTQWDREENGGLTPEGVTPGSHRKVWWVGATGHRWQAMVKVRVAGCGCPVCANRSVRPGENDLATAYPEAAAQWHPTRNGSLTPRDVLPGAQRRVWWQCERGHEWQARISARTYGGSGCPYCAGKRVAAGENELASAYPELAAQWHPTLNGGLTPDRVTTGSHKRSEERRVGKECRSRWSYTRARGRKCGCPVCAGTAGTRGLAAVGSGPGRERRLG